MYEPRRIRTDSDAYPGDRKRAVVSFDAQALGVGAGHFDRHDHFRMLLVDDDIGIGFECPKPGPHDKFHGSTSLDSQS